MDRASCGPDQLQGIRLNVPDCSDSSVCESKRWKSLQFDSKKKRLERFGEVEIVDKTNCFGLNFAMKLQCISEHHPRHGSGSRYKSEYEIH